MSLKTGLILNRLPLDHPLIDLCLLDHARLKDHVATMNGKLEAQVYEGG